MVEPHHDARLSDATDRTDDGRRAARRHVVRKLQWARHRPRGRSVERHRDAGHAGHGRPRTRRAPTTSAASCSMRRPIRTRRDSCSSSRWAAATRRARRRCATTPALQSLGANSGADAYLSMSRFDTDKWKSGGKRYSTFPGEIEPPVRTARLPRRLGPAVAGSTQCEGEPVRRSAQVHGVLRLRRAEGERLHGPVAVDLQQDGERARIRFRSELRLPLELVAVEDSSPS